MPKKPDPRLQALAALALQPVPSHAPTSLNPAPRIPLGRGERIGPMQHTLAEFAAMPAEQRKRTALRESLNTFNAEDVGALGEGLMTMGQIRAFHGSPHHFEKFDISKMGTGEGAQVYGPGHYFAEAEGTAAWYRKKLAGPPRDKTLGIDKTPVWSGNRTYDPSEHDVMGHIVSDDIAPLLESQIQKLPPEARDAVNAMIDNPVSSGSRSDAAWKYVQSIVPPDFDLNVIHDLAPRRQYDRLNRGMLELHARASYNKPGREGVERIKQDLVKTLENYDRMKASGERIPDSTHYHMNDARDALYALNHYGDRLDILPPEKPGAMYEVNIDAEPDELLHWDKPLSEQSPKVREALEEADIPMRERWKESGAWEHVQGKDLWEQTISGVKAERGWDRASPGVFPAESEASRALRAKGIKGIRYLDQMSRGSGEGTHNIVVFDDDLIDIKRKYAALAALGAGGAAANRER